MNTSIGNNVFHFLRATFASTFASCVNGAKDSNFVKMLHHWTVAGGDELHVKLPVRAGDESPSLRARGLPRQHGHPHNYSSTNSSTPQSRSKAGNVSFAAGVSLKSCYFTRQNTSTFHKRFCLKCLLLFLRQIVSFPAWCLAM